MTPSLRHETSSVTCLDRADHEASTGSTSKIPARSLGLRDLVQSQIREMKQTAPSSGRRVIFPALHTVNNPTSSTTQLPAYSAEPLTAPRCDQLPSKAIPSASNAQRDIRSVDLFSSVRHQHVTVSPLQKSPTVRKNVRVTGTQESSSRIHFVADTSEDCPLSRRSILPPGITETYFSIPLLKRERSVSCAPFPSILRDTPRSKKQVCKISSVESDIPSLASSSTQSSSEDLCFEALKRQSRPKRSVSEPFRSSVTFDPKVWVREFRRTKSEMDVTWYNEQDMEAFRMEALKRIVAYSHTQLIPTGTGRTVQRQVPVSKAFFSHKALSIESEVDETPCEKEPELARIERVLIVDPHDICLKLFTKSIAKSMPCASISTARSSEQALQLVHDCHEGFDLILIEERLKLFHHPHQSGGESIESLHHSSSSSLNYDHASGSILMRTLTQLSPSTLFIGVSAHMKADGPRLQESGADFIWSKPPPVLTASLVESMRQRLDQKRSRRLL